MTDTVNPNIPVSCQASTGYAIGAGLKQVPSYAAPVTGFAQVQALTSADLRHLDGLNIQGATYSIILRGPLNAVVRTNSKGGDLVSMVVKPGLLLPCWSNGRLDEGCHPATGCRMSAPLQYVPSIAHRFGLRCAWGVYSTRLWPLPRSSAPRSTAWRCLSEVLWS